MLCAPPRSDRPRAANRHGRVRRNVPGQDARKIIGLLATVRIRGSPLEISRPGGKDAFGPGGGRGYGRGQAVTQARGPGVQGFPTEWAHLGSNQGPPACEAGALPLSYAPRDGLL
jgi:hypothetical protein